MEKPIDCFTPPIDRNHAVQLQNSARMEYHFYLRCARVLSKKKNTNIFKSVQLRLHEAERIYEYYDYFVRRKWF